VAGRLAVSNVVPSAARGLPVVALALPVRTSAGPRVFSAAFGVSKTPLGAYISRLLVLPGRRVYLIDATGRLMASTQPMLAGGALDNSDRRLARLVAGGHRVGTYSSSHGEETFVVTRVAGTPWSIVASEPTAQLYSSIDTGGESLAWLALAGLAIAGLVIIVIGVRLIHGRDRLKALAAELDRLARIDPLTELSNRRDLDETLDAALSMARRRRTPLSVLLIDVDHFKRINDTLGHEAGDAILVQIARSLRASLRAEDSLGRWGGEEFLAVLPNTDSAEARAVAERLRVDAGANVQPHPGEAVTLTVGVAQFGSDSKSELVSRADRALYAGKGAGRNTVHTAPDRREGDLLAIR
jgi:diguanylate cyclase (GGDEF)-like protein